MKFAVHTYMDLQLIRKLVGGIRTVAFPSICACCGFSTSGSDSHICEWCRDHRFETPKTDGGELLPEFILHRFSMWAFDKGGLLQGLLHGLKYHHLKDIGIELGAFLGEKYLNTHLYREQLMEGDREPIIVPVPLHKKRQRRRGYNQARVLATGISKQTGWSVVPEKSIIRIKNTKTQTGLTSSERQRNLEGAFEYRHSLDLDRYIPLLVDDVFTTGATTFELARAVKSTDSQKAVILTAASA